MYQSGCINEPMKLFLTQVGIVIGFSPSNVLLPGIIILYNEQVAAVAGNFCICSIRTQVIVSIAQGTMYLLLFTHDLAVGEPWKNGEVFTAVARYVHGLVGFLYFVSAAALGTDNEHKITTLYVYLVVKSVKFVLPH